MNSYLFRGREIVSKKWVYGGYHEHKPSITAIGKQPETEALIIADGYADWNMPVPIKACVVEKETVGQYTGFNAADSNRYIGSEKDLRIFKGDIVHILSNMDEEEVFEVVFDHGAWELDPDGQDDPISLYIQAEELKNYRIIKIIGNIHDSPELLRGESNE